MASDLTQLKKKELILLCNFWGDYALRNINWKRKFDKCLEKNPFALTNEYLNKWNWFRNGIADIKSSLFQGKKCSEVFITNYDCEKNLIQEITYEEFLTICANTVSRILGKEELKKIMIIGSASPETSTLMVSTALAGKCHSVLFEDLSPEAIISRIKIFNPEIIFIRETLDPEKLNQIKIFCDRNNIIIEIFYKLTFKKATSEILNSKENCEDLNVYKSIPKIEINNKDYLFCLFTSGSTGKPKAIWHSYISYLVYTHYTFTEYFLKSGASKGIFCATDAAWINGHTYALYGPLITSTRTIFVSNLNSLQNPKFLELFLESTKPSFFYTSVTLLRAIRSMSIITSLQKLNNKKFSIVGLGSCGEPLADEVAKWSINFFSSSNNYIVNTYFQTETGGVLSAPTKENGLITNHATVGKSNFPIKIISNYDGSLLVKYPWPGCFSEVTSDREPDYWGKYNFFNLHDQGYYDGKSFLFIGGRTDDVINISGHRISTAEIESCCIGSSLKISEAAAVGINDVITGSKIVLFCVSQNNTFNDQEILKLIIKKNLTPFHRPWKVIFISTLPKTKSGKIARRLLRRALSQDFNFKNEDLSTIMNYQEFLLALKEISLS